MRPRCCECVSRDSDCQYLETETTQTKRRHADLEELCELLKTLPEEDAFKLLGKLRAGVDVRELVQMVEHGSMLIQFASSLANQSQRQDSQGSQESTKGLTPHSEPGA